MNQQSDLRTTRLQRSLTLEDLASLAGLRSATLQEIETGKRLPRRSTQIKIERILGKVDWMDTLSADRSHIGWALRELVNLDAPGVEQRIKYARKYLTALESLNT